MAISKKFFVDIDLQGNGLNNATIGANASMTKGGSFRYNTENNRLEYYNETSVEEVANLSDISAVTGGLIFQTGYDAATNTPDIADGNALKGYFWVVTVAGTFLGESVQVGDSIIAKVDEAGATISDWLILQGNVVVATDTVDGIVRLATQGEADAGTEGGAVVITPATLQGKIDAQITPEITNKLPLAGGTMSGTINMDSNDITNVNNVESGNVLTDVLGGKSNFTGNITVYSNLNFQNKLPINLPAPVNGGDAANKTYVDDTALAAENNAKAYADSLAPNYDAAGSAATAQANAESYADSLAPNYDPAGAASTAESNANDYTDTGLAAKLDLAGGTMSGNINMDGNYIGGASIIGTTDLQTDKLSINDGPDIELANNLDAKNLSTIINLPAPTNGGDAANKTYVDGAASTAESNANAYTDAGVTNAINHTDTEIAALSFTGTIEGSGGVTGWTYMPEEGTYVAYLNHNLGSKWVVPTTSVGDNIVEFNFQLDGENTVLLRSNIEPVNTVTVSVVKANGNL
jgi:hypothetical protein